MAHLDDGNRQVKGKRRTLTLNSLARRPTSLEFLGPA